MPETVWTCLWGDDELPPKAVFLRREDVPPFLSGVHEVPLNPPHFFSVTWTMLDSDPNYMSHHLTYCKLEPEDKHVPPQLRPSMCDDHLEWRATVEAASVEEAARKAQMMLEEKRKELLKREAK